jgi:hypothetical protein
MGANRAMTSDPYKTIQAARARVSITPHLTHERAHMPVEVFNEVCEIAQQALEECERLKARLREAEILLIARCKRAARNIGREDWDGVGMLSRRERAFLEDK